MHQFIKKWGFYFSLTVIIAIAYSCTYNKKSDPSPSSEKCLTPTDSANLSFSTTILPILKSNCERCHKAGGQSPVWDNYTNVSTYADQINAYISGPDPYMPKDGAKVPPCDIIKIQTWIKNGKKG